MNVDEIQKIVDNAMIMSDCESEAALAEKMGMSSQNFNQKKRRGTIVKAINKFLRKNIIPFPNDELQEAIQMLEEIFRSGDERKKNIVRKCMEDIKKEERLDRMERAIEKLLEKHTDPPDEVAEGGHGK